MATIGYQGSTTRHLTRQYNLNLVYAAQGIPLNPVVNGVDWYANDGKARFNALLGEIRHRFSNSFELTAQYRWSQSMDMAPTTSPPITISTIRRTAWGRRTTTSGTRSRCSASGRR